MLWPLWPVIGCSFRATSQSIKYVKSRKHHKIMTWWWVKTSQGRYEHPKSPGDFLQKPGDKPQLLRRYLKHYRRCEFSYSIHVYIVYKCIVISVGYSDGPQFFFVPAKNVFRFWTFFSRFSRRRMTRSTKRFCTPCPLAAQPVPWNQQTPQRTHTPSAMSLWTAAATTCFAWRTPGPWELSWAIYPAKIL